MDLAYFAADTFGVTLYHVKSKLVAEEVHQLNFGSWRLEAEVKVESDCIGSTEMGFWVTVAKKIRLYSIIKHNESWMFVLDEGKLKECGKKTGFEGSTPKQRVQEFKPAIRHVYRWREKGWEKVLSNQNFGG